MTKWKTEITMSDKGILEARTHTKPESKKTANTFWSSVCTKQLLEKDEELAQEKIGETVLHQIKSIKEKL